MTLKSVTRVSLCSRLLQIVIRSISGPSTDFKLARCDCGCRSGASGLWPSDREVSVQVVARVSIGAGDEVGPEVAVRQVWP